jgi:hypothetical protein
MIYLPEKVVALVNRLSIGAMQEMLARWLI